MSPHDDHVYVSCTAALDGRIIFDVPPQAADDAQLLLRLRPKKGQPEQTLRVLDLEVADDGLKRAVLDPLPVLPEGRWDVYLLLDGGTRRHRLLPGLRDLRALVEGHVQDRSAPLAVRIPYVTKDGYLALRTWLRPGHAEVGRIQVTERATTVAARLHGLRLGERAVVHLRLRGTVGTVHTLEPKTAKDGRSFSFALLHEQLAAETGAGDAVWDVFVQPDAGTPMVRAGRLLDDLADRKEVFVYPTITVDGGAVLRPYYTVDNDFAIQVVKGAG